MNAFERARGKVGDRTLVIIDMQGGFEGYEEVYDLIPVICKLIRYARQEKWAIIIVEYEGNGPTESDILYAVNGYDHCSTVTKSENNGGREVINCIKAKRTWSFDLLVCGIYGDFCVPSTVAGLFDCSDLVEVDILIDAVFPNYCSESPQVEGEHGQQREGEVTMDDIIEHQNVSIMEDII